MVNCELLSLHVLRNLSLFILKQLEILVVETLYVTVKLYTSQAEGDTQPEAALCCLHWNQEELFMFLCLVESGTSLRRNTVFLLFLLSPSSPADTLHLEITFPHFHILSRSTFPHVLTAPDNRHCCVCAWAVTWPHTSMDITTLWVFLSFTDIATSSPY